MNQASVPGALPSHDTLTWAAEQIVRQHDEPPEADRATGHCAQCTDHGCPMLSWAYAVLSPALAGSH
jgi:hypothetical protein